MVEVGAFDEAVVDKEVLIATGFFGGFGFADEAVDVEVVGIFLNADEPGIVLVSQDLDDALFEGAFFEVKEFLSVVGEGEEHLGECEGHADEFVYDVSHFCGVAFEEVAACGHVEEEVLHGDAGAGGCCDGFLFVYDGVVDFYAGADFVFSTFGAQFDLCDGCYGGECFATKSHGADVEEVVYGAYFGGGVSFKAQACVGVAHAATVVDYLQQGFAGIGDDEAYFCCFGIHCVFQELFYCAGRSLDNLSCCYLVGNVVW